MPSPEPNPAKVMMSDPRWRWLAGMEAECPTGGCGETLHRLGRDAGPLFSIYHTPNLRDPATARLARELGFTIEG